MPEKLITGIIGITGMYVIAMRNTKYVLAFFNAISMGGYSKSLLILTLLLTDLLPFGSEDIPFLFFIAIFSSQG
jgi:hypothetical protein